MKICKPEKSYNDSCINKAAEIIKNGGVVAFPTDTLYGLAADPFNQKAVERIFTIKKRSENKPILILISQQSQLEELTEKIPDAAKKLMEKFWPGPLTIVFPNAKVSGMLCGGGKNIGVRFPNHALSWELIKKAGVPITATSANITGMEDAGTALDVLENIGSKVDLIIDGGASSGQPSTVVSVERKITVIREGLITGAEISGVLMP